MNNNDPAGHYYFLKSVRTNDVRKFLTKNKTHNSDAHFLIIKLSNYVKHN